MANIGPYKFTSSGIVEYAANMTVSALLVLPLLESIHVNTKTTISAVARIVSTAKTKIGWLRLGVDASVGPSDCDVSPYLNPCSCICSCPCSSPTSPRSASCIIGFFANCRETRKTPAPAEKASGTRPTAGAGLLETTPCARQRGNAGRKVQAVTIRNVRVSAIGSFYIESACE